jgi:hypothetical protein
VIGNDQGDKVGSSSGIACWSWTVGVIDVAPEPVGRPLIPQRVIIRILQEAVASSTTLVRLPHSTNLTAQ